MVLKCRATIDKMLVSARNSGRGSKNTYACDAKVTTTLRVGGAGLEEGLAFLIRLFEDGTRGGRRKSDEGHDEENSGSEELHV